MGQYGNQPDFGTKAKTVIPTGAANDKATGEKHQPGMLYVGVSGDLVVTVVGGDENGVSNSTFFKSVPIGIFPVIVTNVWENNGNGKTTTAEEIVVLY